MITIKKILSAGGAGPYQFEGITTDNRWFYLTFVGGTLTYGLWKSAVEYKKNRTGSMFMRNISDRSDDFPDHQLITKYTNGIVGFPPGFVHQYDALLKYDNNFPPTQDIPPFYPDLTFDDEQNTLNNDVGQPFNDRYLLPPPKLK